MLEKRYFYPLIFVISLSLAAVAGYQFHDYQQKQGVKILLEAKNEADKEAEKEARAFFNIGSDQNEKKIGQSA